MPAEDLDHVHKLLDQAGFQHSKTPRGTFRVDLDMPEERGQQVHLSVAYDDAGRAHLVLESPCLDVHRGILKLPIDLQSAKLLRANGHLVGGAFARMDWGRDSEVIGVRYTRLLEGVAASEIQGLVRTIAKVADDVERERGFDKY